MSEKKLSVTANDTLKITYALLEKFKAGKSFQKWFTQHFPDGGDYAEVVKELRKYNEFEYESWLISRMYDAYYSDPIFIKATVMLYLDLSKTTDSAEDAQIGSSGRFDKIGSAGDFVRIGSCGVSTKIGSAGDYAKISSGGLFAQIGSTGEYAEIASTGDFARIGSTGDYAQIGSSGYGAKIGSSSEYAKITATGARSVVACAGSVGSISLGEKGCAVVPWENGDRTRFAIAYVGENGIKANTAYSVNEKGEFIEVPLL